MKKILTLLVLSLSFLVSFAQDDKDWAPIGVWPFVNKQFRQATVYTGVFHQTATVVPCNIHVGKQALWYIKNDTLLEAIPGTVIRVEFKHGDTYMPVGNEQQFGRIIKEDFIDGKIARVIHVRTVDQHALDQKYVDYLNKTQNILQGSTWSALADTEGGRIVEEEPLPMTDIFYFQVRGEIFQATTKNILARINPERKREYRNFTRSAEIISTNESSMMKVWNEFFLKW